MPEGMVFQPFKSYIEYLFWSQIGYQTRGQVINGVTDLVLVSFCPTARHLFACRDLYS